MTGYGQGTAERDGRRAVVEIRAVNHRFLDLKIRGGTLDPAVEEGIASAVRKQVERGSVTVSVRLDRQGAAAGLRIEPDTARRVYAELLALRETLGLSEPVSLALVCAQPGVLVAQEDDSDAERVSACIDEATRQALSALLAMREVEGKALALDLIRRLTRLAELATEIETRAASAPEEARRRLEERLARLLQGSRVELDPGRLAQEVALVADRLDVTEELVRLRSHMEQAGQLAAETGTGVGRRLDFLVQEMGREVNTIGSKSQSAEIARAVVAAKAELEKIREQIQNIE